VRKLILMLIMVLCLCLVVQSTSYAKPSIESSIDNVNLHVRPLTQEEIDQANAEESSRYAEILDRLSTMGILDIDFETNSELVYPLDLVPEYRFLNAPRHQQLEAYWCGPASVLAIIDYFGFADDVQGSTEYEKQETIADESGTTKRGSNTLDLKNTLTSYVGGEHTYVVRRIGSYSDDYDALWNILYDTIIVQDCPVLIAVETSSLPYYNGNSYYHYIVVDGMTVWKDEYSGRVLKSMTTVRVMDPHYNNLYYGGHEILFTELLEGAVGFCSASDQAYNLAY